MIRQAICPHDFAERESSVATEGYCPICQAATIGALLEDVDRLRTPVKLKQPINSKAFAIGETRPSGRFHVRRVVWGRLLAREEKRPGETIKPVTIFVRERG
jgi:hypothetical protein